METFKYYCNYCQKEYVPKRRGIQKFCSNSCRSRSHQIKKKTSNYLAKTKSELKEKEQQQNQYQPKVNLPDITNTVIGVTIVELIKNALASFQNKTVTKADIQRLENIVKNNSQRYFLVKNQNMRYYGKFPYFDIETQTVVHI